MKVKEFILATTLLRRIGGKLCISLITSTMSSGLIFGKTGLREFRYDHKFENEDELRIGIAFLGFAVVPQSDIKIQLPNYMTKERYEQAI